MLVGILEGGCLAHGFKFAARELLVLRKILLLLMRCIDLLGRGKICLPDRLRSLDMHHSIKLVRRQLLGRLSY